MTLPPEKLGDKGQCFIVETLGWPRADTDDWQPAGYAPTEEGAVEMAFAFLKCPGCEMSRVRDREAT